MATVQFAAMQSRPTAFLDFTSLTLDEFQELIPPFEAAFQAHMAAWRLDRKPRTARRLSVYQHCPLPTPEDRLFFLLTYLLLTYLLLTYLLLTYLLLTYLLLTYLLLTYLLLTYLKTYSLQVVQGRLFGMGQSKTHQWIHVLLPALLAALRTLGDAPARSLTALAQRLGVAEAASVVGSLEEEPAPIVAVPVATLDSPLLPMTGRNDALWFCRKFSLKAFCGMISLHDQRSIMREQDDGDQFQRGPFPPRSHSHGCPLVCGVPAEHAPCRRTHGGTRGGGRSLHHQPVGHQI